MANKPEDNSRQAQEDRLVDYMADHDNKLPRRTRGEKIFDNADWYGIGLGGNTALTLYLNDASQYSGLWQWLNNWTMGMANLGRKEEKWTPEQFARSRVMTDHLAGHEKFKHIFDEVGGEAKLFQEELKKLKGDADFTKAADRKLLKQPLLSDAFEALHGKGILKSEIRGEQFAKEFHTLLDAGIAFNKNKFMLDFVMLTTGGFLVMAPVKWMEDFKKPIVQKFDQWFGSGKSEEETQARHDYLTFEPKQSWLSVFGSRVVGFIGIVTFFLKTGGRRNILSDRGIDFKGARHYSEEWLAKPATTMLEENSLTKESMEKLEQKLGEGTLDSYKEAGGKFCTDDDFNQARMFREDIKNAEGQLDAKDIGRKRSIRFFNDLGIEASYSTVLATVTYALSRVFAPVFDVAGRKHVEDIRTRAVVRKEQIHQQEKQMAASPAPEEKPQTAAPETAATTEKSDDKPYKVAQFDYQERVHSPEQNTELHHS